MLTEVCSKVPGFCRRCYTSLMHNMKVSLHIALACLVTLLIAPIVSAECVQESFMEVTLPPCKPAASAPCYVVGGNSEICSSEPASRLATGEWFPEYPCYHKYGICERDNSGQCGWRNTDELSHCIAYMRRGFIESVTPCTTCTTTQSVECPTCIKTQKPQCP
jgi:hypothetical protein